MQQRYTYDVYIAHCAGTKDGRGRESDARAARVAERLAALGLSVRFDARRASLPGGQLLSSAPALDRRIDASATVLVLLTQAYLREASGHGELGDADPSKAAFEHALVHRGVGKMLAAVMEPACRNARAWPGLDGGRLGGTPFVDLSADDAKFDVGIERIAEQLIRPTGIVDPEITVRPTEGQIDTISFR
jgi:hypothetical protein